MTPEARPADEAFSLLGNETRMGIIRALGRTDEPVAFSTLRDEVGVTDSGQFNYHLDKLAGHFVRQSEAGYVLSRSGRRVFEAVRAGSVGPDPLVEPSGVDVDCPLCGSPLEVSYGDNRVKLLCPDCDGMTGRVPRPPSSEIQALALGHPELEGPETYGYLGGLFLPPAGVTGRTPRELFVAALTWGNHTHLTAASGFCPRCATDLDTRPVVCETHESADGPCPDCGYRRAALVEHWCPNCRFFNRGMLSIQLEGATELLSFLLDHGLNPLSPDPGRLLAAGLDYEEEVVSVDPFEGRFTFTEDDEALTLTVNHDLEVVKAERRPAAG